MPGERLRARKATWPCKGTEVVVVLEDHDAGTRITVVQTGFGDGFADQRRWLGTGWWPIVADLAVYLERGVSLGRHLTPWASLGCPVTEAPGGLTVGAPAPGSFADQAGLREGDLVVRLAGSPVVGIPDLAVLLRSLRPRTATKVRYLRGAEVRSGTGTM